MSKLILLVEDHEEEQAIFSRYLEFVGSRVLVAGDGEAGMRAAEVHHPDLILLDIRLPGVDGWTVMRRLQTSPSTAAIPVVAITALDLPADRLDTAGFCGYLRKPLAPYAMLEEVERCLGRMNELAEGPRRGSEGWGLSPAP